MRFNRTNIKNLVMAAAAALAVSALSAQAAFNPPGQAPPAGNVEAPIYSVGSSQVLSGGLTVSSGGFTATVSSGTAIAGSGGAIGLQGTGASYGLQGTVTGDLGGGDAALYANAFGSDATDYAAVFYGGLGVQIASGDIHFVSRDSGISWPRVSDGSALYGITVTTGGELQLRGHGAGITFLDQNLNSRLTVSEAGVVNVAAGGSLQVNGVNVCLFDNTNCPPPDLGAAGGWTDDGATVRLTTPGDSVGIGTASPSSKLQVNPATNVEGVRVVSSNYSPIIARNTADSADLFRVDQSGNVTAAGNVTASGALSGTTLNTGQGAYELYAMNQNVRTTDSPTFSALTLSNDLSAAHNKSIRVDNAGANTTILIGNYGDGGGFAYGANYTASLSVEGNVKADGLCIEDDCRTSWAAIEGAQNLLQVLQTGSDASPFAGNTRIGGNVYVASGELEAKWLHATAAGDNTIVGNLGIGTTGPGAKLDVGDTTANLLKSVLARGPESNYLGIKTYNTQPVNTKTFAIEHFFGATLNSAINFYRGSSVSGGFIRFATNNGTEQVTITNTGNVGIGTTGPLDKLEVKYEDGTADSFGGIAIYNNDETQRVAGDEYGSGIEFYFDNAGQTDERKLSAAIYSLKTDSWSSAVATNKEANLIFYTMDENSFTEKMRIQPNGNVGIGTTAPNKLLHIKTASGNAEIDIQSAASPYWAIYQDDASDELRFWSAASNNLLTLKQSGGDTGVTVNNKTVCLSDGANCLVGTTPNLQSVTDAGNTTTNRITVSGSSAPGYPLHIIDDDTTSVVNVDSNQVTKLWSGLRVARQGSEKWFIGIDASTDDLLFRRAGATNDVTINTSGVLSGNGSGLTSLNASNLSSGTVSDARLSANVTKLGSGIDFLEWDQNCANNEIPKRVGGVWQCAADSSGAGTVTGSGTTNYVPKWTGASSLGNSTVYDDSGNVAIGHTNAGYPLHIMDNNSTSIVSLDSNDGVKRWSGLRIARQGNEKWFVGLDDTASESLVFRRTESSNDVTISTSGVLGASTIDTGPGATEVHLMNQNVRTGDTVQFAQVGIGTVGPARLLEVVGGSSGAETILAQLRSNFSSQNTATTLRFGNSISANDTLGTAEITALRRDVTTGNTDLIFRTNSSSGVTEKMRILSSGNVGIGTASPDNKLTVAGNANVTGNVGIGTTSPLKKLEVADSFLQTNISLGSWPGILLHNTNTANDIRALFAPAMYFRQEYNSGAQSGKQGRILSYSGGDYFYLQDTDDGGTSWSTVALFSNAVASAINSDLTVGGTLAVTGNATVAGQSVCRRDGINCPPAGTTPNLLAVLNAGSDASTFAGTTAIGGTVGIGTASPNTKLTVYNSGGGIVDLETSDAAVAFGDVLGELQFRGLDASVTHQVGALIRAKADNTWNGSANDAPSRLEFYTQSDGTGNGLNVPQLIIRSSGNVGIGTVSPGDNLHVYTSTTQTTPQMYIEQDSTGDAAIELGIVGDSYIVGIDNSDSDKFKISYSTTQGAAVLGTNDRLVIDASGNVTIGGIVTATGGFSGPGSNLTGLNASNLSSGTVPLARLSGITTTELSVSAGITAGQISPNIVSSVDGVSVDGGNIDLVAGSGITLVPDNGAKTITISAAGGGADIATASCDSGNISPPSQPFCYATCPAGYEIVNAEVLCSLGGDYVGEGGNPGVWGCTKVVWSSSSTRVLFRGTNTASGDKRVYGTVWCIQN